MRVDVIRKAVRHEEVSPVHFCQRNGLLKPSHIPLAQLERCELVALQFMLIQVFQEMQVIPALFEKQPRGVLALPSGEEQIHTTLSFGA